MRTYVPCILITMGVGLGACEGRHEAPPPVGESVPARSARAPSEMSRAPEVKADEADLKIATEIRRLIMEDKSLSTAAQGCKIAVTQGGVTLTGLVDTRAERESIETKAKSVDGVTRVDNKLEVKPPK